MTLRFDYVTKTATKIEDCRNNQERASFEAFNPNGLLAAKKNTDDQIRELVDAGRCKFGAHMAYGSMNDYGYKKLMKLVMKKRIGSSELRLAREWLEDDIRKAREFIAETK